MNPCAECGMRLDDPGEYHPHEYCVLHKAGIDPKAFAARLLEHVHDVREDALREAQNKAAAAALALSHFTHNRAKQRAHNRAKQHARNEARRRTAQVLEHEREAMQRG